MLDKQSTPPGSVEPVADARQIIGLSPPIQRVRKLVTRLRGVGGSVVITGEPGVGKELVARGLRRLGAPFVTVDAATISCSTAESILFGHERGAFTGAYMTRTGLLEQAHGGMLYVDEVANMALDVQAKLLRALQEKEVTRLGGSQTRRLDFRVVCATNQDLEAQCRAGLFRFDLYTRLSVFTVAVPPLRLRVEDIAPLFTFFCQALDAQVCIEPEVWPQLAGYSWPGNVRELSNAAQYAIVMGDEHTVRVHHLPDKVLNAAASAAHAPRFSGAVATACDPVAQAEATPCLQHTLSHRVRAFEAHILRQAYAGAGGNVSQLGRTLGVDRSSLYSKLRRFGIHPKADTACSTG